MDKRRLVLVGVQSPELQGSLRRYFSSEIEGSVLFLATDGTDLLLKASRTKPNLVIFSSDLQKTSAVDVYRDLKKTFPKDPLAFLYLGPELPTAMKDDHSTGSLVWYSPSDKSLEVAIAKALNATGETSSHFKVRHLAPGEFLMKEGEDPEYLYFVLKGCLRALSVIDDKTIELGKIRTGEFVGEMAIISDDKRVATVQADEGCQLLEIPARDFSKMVLTKPSWSKALMSTLTKRLKLMNTNAMKK